MIDGRLCNLIGWRSRQRAGGGLCAKRFASPRWAKAVHQGFEADGYAAGHHRDCEGCHRKWYVTDASTAHLNFPLMRFPAAAAAAVHSGFKLGRQRDGFNPWPPAEQQFIAHTFRSLQVLQPPRETARRPRKTFSVKHLQRSAVSWQLKPPPALASVNKMCCCVADFTVLGP